MAKPTLATATVRAWLEERLGVALSELRRLPAEGEESQAFVFAADGLDGRRVLRVNRDEDGFRKEAFAARRFARPELPIPEVLDVARLDSEHWACASRHVAGTTLQDADPAVLSGLTGAVDRTLAAIAATPLGGTGGYGPFDAAGRGAHTSWRAFVAQPLETSWMGHAVDAAAVVALLAALEESLGACPERRALVHGDFGSNNVLTDGRRVVAVLDWDCALFGDPLYDVANVLFWAPWLECMRIQAEHLRTTLGSDRGSWERLRAYQLRIGLEEIRQLAGDDPHGELEQLVARTLRLLDVRAGDALV